MKWCLCFASILLLLGHVACSGHANNLIETESTGPRIVNGFVASSLSAAPHKVSLRRSYGRKSHFCGGSIISDRWILSAAHCFGPAVRPEFIMAVVGTLRLDSGGDIYEIEKIIEHELYMPALLRNDIALLKTRLPFEKDRGYGPIALGESWTPGNVSLLIYGWGKTSFPGSLSNELMTLSTRSLSNEDCILHYYATPYPRISIGKNLCALTENGEGSCQGDSGGGLIDPVANQVVGIVSWGIPCAVGMPDIYTRVSEYLGWIRPKIEEK